MYEDEDALMSPCDEPQDLSASAMRHDESYTTDDELESEDSGSEPKRGRFEDNNNIEGYDLSSKREFLASLELERSPEFEEEQDCFIEEFRRMKAKGEFTCRLCSAVFPNLRALKSHNRVHLIGPLYNCNLCPYSSSDRSTLVQHMRSHNGDRPFECAVCKFAFTTKANCERHLRNRHTKEAATQMDLPIDLSLKKKEPSDVLYPYLSFPYFIPPPLVYQNLQKDLFRGLQLTGGRLVERKVHKEEEEVKMVIKNGVLVPKQKQRRYRTERPFGCDHCQARFTLRSNMERHIKQQHPEFWSQRQRSGSRKSRESRNEPREIPLGVKAAIVEQIKIKEERRDGDLASVSKLLDNASAQTFRQYFDREEEDEEGLVASNSEHSSEESSPPINCRTSPGADGTGSDGTKKRSAYSLAPNRVSCPYCSREFPWTSSLRRHILTHTGQKPYKCDSCPLLFTTKSNCDRHSVRKHGGVKRSDRLSTGNTDSTGNSGKTTSLDEFHDRVDEKRRSAPAELQSAVLHNPPNMAGQCSNPANNSINHSSAGSEMPFKCHLCDGSFPERQDTLDHLKQCHGQEYNALVAKGALDSCSETEEADNESSNKDQSNRKVMCAFCLRRFWSAEDLRRHMRTHTGERPFSCELCSRRFTLKHSMLRHKKKHASASTHPQSSSAMSPNDAKPQKSDLISNLLGIRDSSIVETMLTSTPTDAAKILGLQNAENNNNRPIALVKIE
ncbi:ZnF_C2H2 [Nesidiocoris tenuis]|uniref:ZnF_C2H2 n=1 Tax=Nesidiocoris tenuis TaxID=355587 RepID=A0ABN7B5P3_9HEMI|nr:ZnF_C2H2 [Nesidiocoris tenuis]